MNADGMRFGLSTAVIILGWIALTMGVVGLVLLVLPPMWVLLFVMYGWASVAVALSPFILFGGGMALIGAGRRISRKRGKLGLCRGCGYDLRGIASERCPECGLEK